MFSCKSHTRKKSLHLIQNQNLLRLRLSYQEKIYYSDLFMMYQDNKTGNVYLDQFPKLLGIFGTDIAEDIAKRIFEIFSGNKNYITLSEYLKYVDVYHYGDETERCNVTCKLMDFNNSGNIRLSDFKKYINLIIGAVRKVNPSLKSELFSEEDIEVLFNKISNNKEYFTYNEFATVYNEKPEILSWIDYFKNDSNDILLIIHKNIKKIIKNLYKLNFQINSIIKNYRHKNFEKGENNDKIKEFLDLIIKIQKIFNNFKHDVNMQNEQFMNFAKNYQISLRNLFSIISQNDDDKDEEDDFDNVNDNNNIDIDDNDNENDINKEKDQKYFTEKKNKINPFLLNNDIKRSYNNNMFESIKNRNKMQRIHTIKNFFDDIKKNLNSNFGHKKRNHIRRQSYQTRNYVFNKLFIENEKNPNKINNNHNILEFENENNENEESSEISDFMITEEDEQDMSVLNKKINILKTNISLKINNLENSTINNLIQYNNGTKPIHNKVSNDSDEIKKIYFEESTKNKTFKELNGLLLKHTCSANNNSVFSVDEKDEKYLKYMDKLLKFFESTSKIFFKSLINLNESYKWIELRYLKKTIINQQNMKREESKKNINKEKNFNKNNNNKRLKSIAVKNIPKNRLKTTDDSFKILLNTIMGIQIAVESSPDVSEIQDVKQFLNSMTYSIQTANLSKNKQEIFRIKEYAGIVFNSIRKLYGYDKESFIQSISPQVFITEMIISNTTSIEELFNTGRSGSLFYYTRDGKFILKTISKSEYKTLKRILPKYYYHLMKYKNTFLPKFFGCYKLLKKVKKKRIYVYFIIMMNVFSTSKQIHVRFDLKGSTLAREVISKEEKLNKDFEDILGKYSFALKDLDFDYFKKNIYINESIYNDLIEQLNADSLVLKECNINDYSLLLGIHKKKPYLHNNTNICNNINNSNNLSNNLTQLSISYNNIDNNNEDKNFCKENANKSNDNKKNLEIKDNYLSENISFTSINYSYDKNNSENKTDKKDNYQQKKTHNKIILDDNGIYNEKYREIYYIGIIDILTEYNTLKKCEYCYKSIRYCTNKMSCVAPEKYQSRFINYLRQIILPSNQDTNSGCLNLKNKKKINTYDENKSKKIYFTNNLNMNLSEEKLTSKNKSEIMMNRTDKIFYNIIP